MVKVIASSLRKGNVVEHEDGTSGVEHWSQAVSMRALRKSDY